MKFLIPYTPWTLLRIVTQVMGDRRLMVPIVYLQFSAKASSQIAVDAVKEEYRAAMHSLVGGDKPALEPKDLEAAHEEKKKNAIDFYFEKNKYGKNNERVSNRYRQQLEDVRIILSLS